MKYKYERLHFTCSKVNWSSRWDRLMYKLAIKKQIPVYVCRVIICIETTDLYYLPGMMVTLPIKGKGTGYFRVMYTVGPHNKSKLLSNVHIVHLESWEVLHDYCEPLEEGETYILGTVYGERSMYSIKARREGK